MKKLALFILAVIFSTYYTFARENDFEANNFASLKEFFQKNISTLNPIEGVYHISVTFSCDDRLIQPQSDFDIFVIESESSKTVFDVLFLGYSDPFDGNSLPYETIKDEPGACIFAGYIFQDGNTNRYFFSFCPFGRSKAIAEQPFILDLGASDFSVEFESISRDNDSYLNIPEKFKNKIVKMSFKATKRFPL